MKVKGKSTQKYNEIIPKKAKLAPGLSMTQELGPIAIADLEVPEDGQPGNHVMVPTMATRHPYVSFPPLLV